MKHITIVCLLLGLVQLVGAQEYKSELIIKSYITYEKKIDISNIINSPLTEGMDCLLETLLNNKQFKETFKVLFDTSKVNDLAFDVQEKLVYYGENGYNQYAGGATGVGVNDNRTIIRLSATAYKKSDNSFIKRKPLEFIKTFIYELYHAKMFEELLAAGIESSAFYDAEKVKEKMPNSNFIPYIEEHGDRWQQEYMAVHNRVALASMIEALDQQSPSLKEQFTQLLPDNDASPYDMLSWIGLQGTKAYDKIESQDKIKLYKLFANYMTKDLDKNCD